MSSPRHDSRPASPRRGSGGGSAFGSSSPRNLELWTGRFHETLQGGGTFNDGASRAPGTYSDRPSSPGPGDYEARPTAFSRGAPGRDARGRKEKPSAAFASASVRLLSADGLAADARGRCGEAVQGEASPGTGHYAPVQTDSIAHKAAQLARHAARANNARGGLRSGSDGKLRNDRLDGPREVTPGPGEYMVAGEKASTNERRKTERSHNSAFLSGSRRVMPWNGMAEGAVRRTSRSLLEGDKEEARNETPGPGAYLKLDLSTATMRRGGSTPTFGRSTSPRFDPPPSLDRMTPSPVHYSSDHTRPSRG